MRVCCGHQSFHVVWYDKMTCLSYIVGGELAVLNIRVEDAIRDELKELADQEGISLSEYVRNLLMDALAPARSSDNVLVAGSEQPQETLRIIDRQILSLLHRILGRVLPENADDVDGDLDYQLMRARILESGYTNEYWYEVSGFKTELSKRDCDRVMDVLDMFRVITFSFDHLREQGESVDPDLALSLEFKGFDRNDGLERNMADYVSFLMEDGRWGELAPQISRNDKGNSHHRMLDTYLRMLSEYRRIKDSRERGYTDFDYLLSKADLEQIAVSRIHPSNRG